MPSNSDAERVEKQVAATNNTYSTVKIAQPKNFNDKSITDTSSTIILKKKFANFSESCAILRIQTFSLRFIGVFPVSRGSNLY